MSLSQQEGLDVNIKARLQQLETSKQPPSKHVIVVPGGRPQWDAQAALKIREGEIVAKRLGMELEVIWLKWLT